MQHGITSGHSISVDTDVECSFIAKTYPFATAESNIVGPSSGDDVVQAILNSNHVVAADTGIQCFGGSRFTAAEERGSPFVAKHHVSTIGHRNSVGTGPADKRIDAGGGGQSISTTTS